MQFVSKPTKFVYSTTGNPVEQRLNRYDVINTYLKKRYPDQCNYLEIGVRNPADNFDKILATHKTSVDPCFEFLGYTPDYKMTSDDFFENFFAGKTKLSADFKWDAIFIDGLHLSWQVWRDLQNSLKCLSKDGLIFLHDCSPAEWWMAHSDYEYFIKKPNIWNGTSWKALYYARTQLPYKIFTVDDDHGVGVIDTSISSTPIEHTNIFFDFSQMAEDRETALGLISVKDFLTQHS